MNNKLLNKTISKGGLSPGLYALVFISSGLLILIHFILAIVFLVLALVIGSFLYKKGKNNPDFLNGLLYYWRINSFHEFPLTELRNLKRTNQNPKGNSL